MHYQPIPHLGHTSLKNFWWEQNLTFSKNSMQIRLHLRRPWKPTEILHDAYGVKYVTKSTGIFRGRSP